MRHHAIVWPTFWTGETGRFLRKAGADAQRVALYLITGPNSTMIGLYHLALPTLCHEVGITEKGALKALARCSEGVFAYYDRGSEGVFVPEMGHYQIGPTLSPKDNRHKAVVKLLEQMRKSPFLKDFMARYAVPYQLPDLSPLQAPCKPLRSQDQEQEQEQEQEKRDTSISEDTDAVIAHYQKHHPKARPGAADRKRIAARFREDYSVEDLCAAIDGCHRSPHHCGDNEQKTKYQSLELIMRDSKHVQQFMEVPLARGGKDDRPYTAI